MFFLEWRLDESSHQAERCGDALIHLGKSAMRGTLCSSDMVGCELSTNGASNWRKHYPLFEDTVYEEAFKDSENIVPPMNGYFAFLVAQ
jgi:hypothetical protein